VAGGGITLGTCTNCQITGNDCLSGGGAIIAIAPALHAQLFISSNQVAAIQVTGNVTNGSFNNNILTTIGMLFNGVLTNVMISGNDLSVTGGENLTLNSSGSHQGLIISENQVAGTLSVLGSLNNSSIHHNVVGSVALTLASATHTGISISDNLIINPGSGSLEVDGTITSGQIDNNQVVVQILVTNNTSDLQMNGNILNGASGNISFSGLHGATHTDLMVCNNTVAISIIFNATGSPLPIIANCILDSNILTGATATGISIDQQVRESMISNNTSNVASSSNLTLTATTGQHFGLTLTGNFLNNLSINTFLELSTISNNTFVLVNMTSLQDIVISSNFSKGISISGSCINILISLNDCIAPGNIGDITIGGACNQLTLSSNQTSAISITGDVLVASINDNILTTAAALTLQGQLSNVQISSNLAVGLAGVGGFVAGAFFLASAAATHARVNINNNIMGGTLLIAGATIDSFITQNVMQLDVTLTLTTGAPTHNVLKISDNIVLGTLTVAGIMTGCFVDHNVTGVNMTLSSTGTLTGLLLSDNNIAGTLTIDGIISGAEMNNNRVSGQIQIANSTVSLLMNDNISVNNAISFTGTAAASTANHRDMVFCNNSAFSFIQFAQNVASSMRNCLVNENVITSAINTGMSISHTLTSCSFIGNNFLASPNGALALNSAPANSQLSILSNQVSGISIFADLSSSAISNNIVGSGNVVLGGILSHVDCIGNVIASSVNLPNGGAHSGFNLSNNDISASVILAGTSTSSLIICQNNVGASVGLQATASNIQGLIMNGNTIAGSFNTLTNLLDCEICNNQSTGAITIAGASTRLTMIGNTTSASNISFSGSQAASTHSNLIFANNQAPSSNITFQVTSGPVAITNSLISGNVAGNGGLNIAQILGNCSVNGNVAPSIISTGVGGGNHSDTLFTGNTCSTFIISPDMQHCTFSNNVSPLSITLSGNVVISVISGNETTGDFLISGALSQSFNSITGNICNNLTITPPLTECVITGNLANAVLSFTDSCQNNTVSSNYANGITFGNGTTSNSIGSNSVGATGIRFGNGSTTNNVSSNLVGAGGITFGAACTGTTVSSNAVGANGITFGTGSTRNTISANNIQATTFATGIIFAASATNTNNAMTGNQVGNQAGHGSITDGGASGGTTIVGNTYGGALSFPLGTSVVASNAVMI